MSGPRTSSRDATAGRSRSSSTRAPTYARHRKRRSEAATPTTCAARSVQSGTRPEADTPCGGRPHRRRTAGVAADSRARQLDAARRRRRPACRRARLARAPRGGGGGARLRSRRRDRAGRRGGSATAQAEDGCRGEARARTARRRLRRDAETAERAADAAEAEAERAADEAGTAQERAKQARRDARDAARALEAEEQR